jgi:hypothetical protein
MVYSKYFKMNIIDYPYYRTIPIKEISDKQQEILNMYKVIEDNRSIESIVDVRPKCETLSKVKLVKMEGTQFYTVDMSNCEKIPSENLKTPSETPENYLISLNETIKKNIKLLQDQHQQISSNQALIQQQLYTIQTNNNYIQEQHNVFNNNSLILNNQYNINNIEIAKQQETIAILNNQINEYQTEITNLQTGLDPQQQLVYHNSMINAFNTVIQNPQYFAQLMATATASATATVSETATVKT